MDKRTILNMLGFKKDPREEEYQRWLQLQGGGGVPNIFTPRYPEQPRAGAWGPSSRPFADPMRMRYWS